MHCLVLLYREENFLSADRIRGACRDIRLCTGEKSAGGITVVSLKKKIIRTFGLFAVLIGLLFGGVYYMFYGNRYEDMAFNQLEQKAALSSQQMSNIVQQMQAACIMLISDQDVLQSIRTLANHTEEKSSYESAYFSDAYKEIRGSINTYFVYENFYRMIFFNENGDVVVGKNIMDSAVDASVTYQDIQWLNRVKESGITLIPCHTDDWGKQKKTVLSLVKKLNGNNLGYIEVQWLKEDLDKFLKTESSEYDILFYNSDGELLYSFSGEEEVDYFSYIKQTDGKNIRKKLSSEGILFTSYHDEENGIIAVAVQHMNIAKELAGSIQVMFCIFCLFF